MQHALPGKRELIINATVARTWRYVCVGGLGVSGDYDEDTVLDLSEWGAGNVEDRRRTIATLQAGCAYEEGKACCRERDRMIIDVRVSS
jgi:hypothetical protein